MRSVLLRATGWGLFILLAALLAGATAGGMLLRGSLPREQGAAAMTGLAGVVEVARDDRGVPIIRAQSGDFSDAAAAMGFVHAQERFFQMDLMRRRAAGELAELLGPAALPSDEEMRRFRFRSVAAGVLDRLPPRHRAWLEAYASGVNAGLADLSFPPPEHLVLRAAIAPWRAEDCVLAGLAMHHGLSFGARFELQYDALAHHAGEAVADFLMPETARFDSPLVGEPGDSTGPRPVPLIPSTTGAVKKPSGNGAGDTRESAPAGSNNWAVSGSRTRDGRAILANDMHLRLSAPGTWFHAQVEWGGRRAVGLTLPGVPGVIAGSNGRVAWGYTNVTGDFEDWIAVEVDPADPARYRFGPGEADYETFGSVVEVIRVRGGTDKRLTFKTTRWGPVIAHDARGRPLVLKWPALDPVTVNFKILDMMMADTLEEAVEVARSWWGPPQNVAIASADGRCAWVVSGWIPKRRGFDGRRPVSWAEPGVGWDGPIDEADRPMLIDPPEGVVFSANARTLPVERARLIGWCWASGERAGRIAELLRAGGGFDERDMLRMQLDTRAAAFDPIRDALLDAVPPDDPDPLIRAARASVESWTGRADADPPEGVGFRVLVRFREVLARRMLRLFWAPARAKDPNFSYWCFQDEEPLLRILEERPAWVLPSGFDDWPAFLRDTLWRSLKRAGGGDYPPDYPWGHANAARIQHPFSLLVPAVGRFLDMPADALPGHLTTLRVQTPTFGASQRLVVSPGREEDGILHLPCGQSGHFLSRHYRDGHGAWTRGEPRPLLAGPPVSAFRLVPVRSD